MRRIKYIDTHCNGPREVTIHEERDGLALQRRVAGDGWTVVHIRSGCTIAAHAIPTRVKARREMRKLLRSGVDWTLPAAQLVNRKAAKKINPKRRWTAPETPEGGWADINELGRQGPARPSARKGKSR